MGIKKRFVKICIKCGSTNIGIPPAGMDITMTIPDHCRDCGQTGLFPEIDETQVEEFRNELKKK